MVSSAGTARTPWSKFLLTTQDAWESPLIENPSMIYYAGRYYLFYSGGAYGNSSYATGYAICTTPLGPCTRASTEPLLATGGRVAGTGGGARLRRRLRPAAPGVRRLGLRQHRLPDQHHLQVPAARLRPATDAHRHPRRRHGRHRLALGGDRG